jgi:hypothetical protein
LKVLLSDLITDVKNGSDYKATQETAYLRIYQSADASYTPRDYATDFCYIDTPPVDSAMFYVARKLLLEAIR